MNEHLPQLRKYIGEEEHSRLEVALKANKTGIDHIDKHMYVPMFKFKDVIDYYDKVSIARNIAKKITESHE